MTRRALDYLTPYHWPGLETHTLTALARIERDEAAENEHLSRTADDPAAAVHHRELAATSLARLMHLNVLIQQAGGTPVAGPIVRLL